MLQGKDTGLENGTVYLIVKFTDGNGFTAHHLFDVQHLSCQQ